jgi:DNA-binding NtrC family response regulator
MRAVFEVLDRAARTDATVLLEGETGTGKELAAEAIHRASPRADGPLVVVDCGSLPPDLIESELFGHERGAFTGADRRRLGAFESAAGGTLFLDEIGELRLDLQPKLLRVLERREVKRLGSEEVRAVDVRVLAATHRDLRTEVNAGRFRSDLYYRLAVLRVALPPLRERVEDLPDLVEALLDAQLGAEAATDAGAARLRTPAVRAQLRAAAWPGNVRELRNYVERVVALGEGVGPPGDDADADDELPPIDIGQPFGPLRERWTAYFERRYLRQLLAATGGKIKTAARQAGISRLQLYRNLERLRLR